ncbi:hypothetical protein [Erwinia sp. E_sp_W01_6]|uniref:hypothetical protein n=1 Tax=Erwinia sp. E_sp_W01_6 TaxID=3039408 RepID=UPI0030CE625E
MQNISLLLMALSRVPPERFNQLLMALTDGANALSRQSDSTQQQGAPGIKGMIKLLRDEDLWRAVTPLLSAVRAFSASMEKAPEKPITRYSGKDTHA